MPEQTPTFDNDLTPAPALADPVLADPVLADPAPVNPAHSDPEPEPVPVKVVEDTPAFFTPVPTPGETLDDPVVIVAPQEEHKVGEQPPEPNAFDAPKVPQTTAVEVVGVDTEPGDEKSCKWAVSLQYNEERIIESVEPISVEEAIVAYNDLMGIRATPYPHSATKL